tara:strand:- start:222 stop:461 length:240 start_codon:yes stop_codon:yes gene_type:complete
MSYEKWLDEKANGSERGLSLKQAYEAGQASREITPAMEKAFELAKRQGRINGQREMLEKVGHWIPRHDYDQLAKELGDE